VGSHIAFGNSLVTVWAGVLQDLSLEVVDESVSDFAISNRCLLQRFYIAGKLLDLCLKCLLTVGNLHQAVGVLHPTAGVLHQTAALVDPAYHGDVVCHLLHLLALCP
jgi:hypothetical protein